MSLLRVTEAADQLEKPLPLHSVLTKLAVVTVTNHTMLALLSMIAMTYILFM